MWRSVPVVCLEVGVIVRPIRDIPPDLETGDEPLLRGSMDGALQATWAFVGLGVVLRVVTFALNFPLWGDEAFVAANFISRGYRDLLRPLDYAQICPLFFLWLELTVIKLFGFSEWSLRLIPTLSSVASVFLFAHLAGRVTRGNARLLAVAIFAVAYYPIRHGAEVKQYSTDLLAALILLALAIEWLRTPERSLWVWRLWPLCRWRWGCLTRPCSWPVVSAWRWRQRPGKRGRRGAAATDPVQPGNGGQLSRAVRCLHAQATARLSFNITIELLGRGFSTHGRARAARLLAGRSAHRPDVCIPVRRSARGQFLHNAVLRGGPGITLAAAGKGLAAAGRGPAGTCFSGVGAGTLSLWIDARTMIFVAPSICLLCGMGLATMIARLRSSRSRQWAFRVTAMGLAVAGFVLLGLTLAHPYKSVSDQNSRSFVRSSGPRVPATRSWFASSPTWASVSASSTGRSSGPLSTCAIRGFIHHVTAKALG